MTLDEKAVESILNSPPRLQLIHSLKYPGDTFFKVRNTKDTFVGKTYYKRDEWTRLFGISPELRDVALEMYKILIDKGTILPYGTEWDSTKAQQILMIAGAFDGE